MIDELAERILQLRGDSGMILKRNYEFTGVKPLKNGFALYEFNSAKRFGLDKSFYVLSLSCKKMKDINYRIFYVPSSISGYFTKSIEYDKNLDSLIISTENYRRRRKYEWDYKNVKTVFMHGFLKCVEEEEKEDYDDYR